MTRLLAALFDPAVWSLARRDARRGLGRLVASAVALAVGLSALVAITSFGVRLDQSLDDQARELLGADLRIESTTALEPELEAELRALVPSPDPGAISKRITFLSMVRLDAAETTRLVRVRAVEGDYPFYGALETAPPEAAASYRREGTALVDRSALEQLGGDVGDTLWVGRRPIAIGGEIVKIPGESLRQSWFGPRVYLPLDSLDPELLGRGSRISYDLFFRLPADVDPEAVADSLDDLARAHDLRVRTAADQRRSWGRSVEDAEGFLSLVAFVALLLGGLGVASAVHVHVLRKRPLAALLRCLGAPGSTALAVVLLQTLGIGVLGTALGLGLGAALQAFLPSLLGAFLPVDVPRTPVFGALVLAAGYGFLLTIAFAVLPLVPLRHVTALAALRRIALPTPWRDPVLLSFAALLVLGVTGFALVSVRRASQALVFVASLGAVLALLWATAKGTVLALRRLVPRSTPFPLRQGLSNLHRPANQTALLLLCIGLGTFLLATLSGSEHQILVGLRAETGAGRANLVFFDVQDSEREGAIEALQAAGSEVLDEVPIVPMRLRAIDGRTIESLRQDETRDLEVWPLLRTYRSTFRSQLEPGERIVAGRFDPQARTGADGVVPISFERDIAERLGVGVGHTIDFDVQGVTVRTRIDSLREVEWRQARPNFYAVFPPGALDRAPKSHVLLVHATDAADSARLQRAVVDAYPTISAVDVESVLGLVDEVLGQLRGVVQFLAVFSLATGALVVLGALLASKRHRLEEALLLRTLGASRAQVRTALVAEWTLVGFVGAFAGSLLSLVGVAALAHFVFRSTPDPRLGTAFLAPLGIAAVTAAIGASAGFGATRRSPLEALREERSS